MVLLRTDFGGKIGKQTNATFHQRTALTNNETFLVIFNHSVIYFKTIFSSDMF